MSWVAMDGLEQYRAGSSISLGGLLDVSLVLQVCPTEGRPRVQWRDLL